MLWIPQDRALLDGLAEGGYDAAFGGARRDEEKKPGKERVYSFRDEFASGTPKTSAPSSGMSIIPAWIKASTYAYSRFELDRARRLAVHCPRKRPHRAHVYAKLRPMVVAEIR